MSDYRDVVNVLNKLGDDPAQAYQLFGQRGYEAWQIVKARQVKKYVFQPSGKVRWIIVGKGREYIIYPDVGYCHCEDFFFQVMEGKAYACQHLIARKLAETLGIYDVVQENDEHFDMVMREWDKTE